jgi:hypothetical protein
MRPTESAGLPSSVFYSMPTSMPTQETVVAFFFSRQKRRRQSLLCGKCQQVAIDSLSWPSNTRPRAPIRKGHKYIRNLANGGACGIGTRVPDPSRRLHPTRLGETSGFHGADGIKIVADPLLRVALDVMLVNCTMIHIEELLERSGVRKYR